MLAEPGEHWHAFVGGRSREYHLLQGTTLLHDKHAAVITYPTDCCSRDEQALGSRVRNDIDIDRLPWP